MFKTKILSTVDSKFWNSNLLKSDYSTFFQTSEYLVEDPNAGLIPIFIHVFNDKDEIVGQLGLYVIKSSALYSSSLLKKALGLFTILTRRGIWLYGPIIHSKDDYERTEIIKCIIDANDKIMKVHNLVFMEGFSPPLDKLVNDSYLAEFEKRGYKITKFVTYITDLSKPVEEIWKKVQKYTKINVKRSAKRGITTKELETIDELKSVQIGRAHV